MHAYWTGDKDGVEVTHHGVGMGAYNDAKTEAEVLGLYVYEARYELVDSSMVFDGTKDMTEWVAAWALVEASGGCDAEGSVEYSRVTDLWLNSDEAEVMEDFIRREANRGSS